MTEVGLACVVQSDLHGAISDREGQVQRTVSKSQCSRPPQLDAICIDKQKVIELIN